MRFGFALLAILPSLIAAQTPAPVTSAPVTPAPVVTAAPVTPAPVVTAAPVTAAPVTQAPVTQAPVTPAPVTPAPVITAAPVTQAPVTPAPVTPAPVVTSAPVTPAPVAPTVTNAPVTPAPVTPPPVTPAPVTPAPVVTAAPVTPAPVTPAPVTPAPVVTSAPVTPAPVAPTVTSAPVTPAPVTSAPIVTVAPVTAAPNTAAPVAPEFVIDWSIPEGASLPSVTANAGDTIKFVWAGAFDVFIHPSGNCTEDGAILVGDTSGTTYTFSAFDQGKDILFVSDVNFHCENGLQLTVTVPAAPTPAPVVPTLAPVVPTPSPTVLTEEVVVDWITPAGSSLPPLSLKVGDTIIFSWIGIETVYIYPSGSCDAPLDRILVGDTSLTSYTLTQAGIITFISDVGTNCENGHIMLVAVEPRTIPTPAPTPAPVTSAPATAAPVTPAPITAAPINPTLAPVTPAPITAAPVVPTMPTIEPEMLEIAWDIPEGDQLPPQTLTVGDSISFVWNGLSNVYIHPSGNCSEEGSILVGNESGVVYTFPDSDGTKTITFASQVGFHCEKGQILKVQVGVRIENNGTFFFIPCFSGDSVVEVENQGPVKMSSLEIGDNVLVADGKYEPVYSFGHKDADSSAEFLKIHSTSIDVPIEISPDHMILANGDHWLPAGKLQTGDSLTNRDGSSSSITKIQQVTRKGVFAPFTKSGSIVVNDVVASNYIGFQGSEYLMVGGVQTPFTYHWMAHTFTSIHRIAVMMGITGETYTDTGVSRWVDVPHKIGTWVLEQHPAVMAAILVPSYIALAALSLLENPMWIFTLLAAVVLARGFTVKKRKTQL